MNVKFDVEKIIKSKSNLSVARKYHEIDNVERIEIKKANSDHYRIEGIVKTKMDSFDCYVICDEFGRVKKYRPPWPQHSHRIISRPLLSMGAAVFLCFVRSELCAFVQYSGLKKANVCDIL